MQQRTPVRRLHEHRLCIHRAAASKRSCVPTRLILAVDQARISCLLQRCGCGGGSMGKMACGTAAWDAWLCARVRVALGDGMSCIRWQGWRCANW